MLTLTTQLFRKENPLRQRSHFHPFKLPPPQQFQLHNSPSPLPGHTPPGGHQNNNNPPSTPRRSTRRSSLALAHDLGEQLGNASESPLTRSRATFLGQQLNQLPAHLQQDVISHAPRSVQAISPLLFLQNWRPDNWGDVLRERVSRMTPYHQGLLVQFAEKTERKGWLEDQDEGAVGKRRWRSDP
ncbi:unnamed protein product [Sordaria macrospora k-hell]|uniref:WGS project CABT00000000 data, contig 2.13 n=1 Tax=Sordaria macrospora (strain ATCC MYA-333 / DSM 997 / K(L3346) / K-hell) TaxID=771870 RepID=F7VY80_SORMK|nr:uncharacterized protein SMAC_08030 [Sordaria macrospora k-hell]CCC10474.1 unnamed protein product [Sordaria macrospora k-hell]